MSAFLHQFDVIVDAFAAVALQYAVFLINRCRIFLYRRRMIGIFYDFTFDGGVLTLVA